MRFRSLSVLSVFAVAAACVLLFVAVAQAQQSLPRCSLQLAYAYGAGVQHAPADPLPPQSLAALSHAVNIDVRVHNITSFLLQAMAPAVPNPELHSLFNGRPPSRLLVHALSVPPELIRMPSLLAPLLAFYDNVSTAVDAGATIAWSLYAMPRVPTGLETVARRAASLWVARPEHVDQLVHRGVPPAKVVYMPVPVDVDWLRGARAGPSSLPFPKRCSRRLLAITEFRWGASTADVAGAWRVVIERRGRDANGATPCLMVVDLHRELSHAYLQREVVVSMYAAPGAAPGSPPPPSWVLDSVLVAQGDIVDPQLGLDRVLAGVDGVVVAPRDDTDGNVAVAAAAAGVPVVASRTRAWQLGAPETNFFAYTCDEATVRFDAHFAHPMHEIDTRAGLYVGAPVCNPRPESLAGAIDALLDATPDDVMRRSARAQQFVAEHFSAAAVGARMRRAFSGVPADAWCATA